MLRGKNTYGLILCGGQSTRMGVDKSLLAYHNIPQRYHLYEMMSGICDKTFISCNLSQLKEMDEAYQAIVDLPGYSSIGPMGALLTAFSHFPQKDFLVLGCDYPFLTKDVLLDFSGSLNEKEVAAAFYKQKERLYEPTLAWYSHQSVQGLMKMFNEKIYSLQYFLRSVGAHQYLPVDAKTTISIDTRESAMATIKMITNDEWIKA